MDPKDIYQFFVDNKDGLIGINTARQLVRAAISFYVFIYKGYARKIFNMILKYLATIIPVELALYVAYVLKEDDFYDVAIHLFKSSINEDEKRNIARSIEKYGMRKIHDLESTFYSSILCLEEFVNLLPYFEYSNEMVIDFINDVLLVVLMNSPRRNLNRSVIKNHFSKMLFELVNKKFDLVTQEFTSRQNDLMFNQMPLNVARAYSSKLWDKIIQEWEPGMVTDVKQFLPLQDINETDLSYLLYDVCEQIEQTPNISFKQPLFGVVKDFYMSCKCFNRDVGEKTSKVSLQNVNNKERLQKILDILCKYIYERRISSYVILDIIICLLWSCDYRESTDNPCFILDFKEDYVQGQWFDLNVKYLKAFRTGGLIAFKVIDREKGDACKNNIVRIKSANSF